MKPDTRDRLLHEAEILIRTRGYAAFSYADLAASVGISKASVHHHFPAKEDLIVVLLGEYLERFVSKLAQIRQRHAGAGQRLRAYARLFLDGFEQGMLPLCGALSAERAALPEILRPQVTDFFRLHLEWLAGVLEDGIAAGTLAADISASKAAMLLLSTLEGGSFVGWALQQKAPVLAAFESALSTLEAPASVPAKKRSAVRTK